MFSANTCNSMVSYLEYFERNKNISARLDSLVRPYIVSAPDNRPRPTVSILTNTWFGLVNLAVNSQTNTEKCCINDVLIKAALTM